MSLGTKLFTADAILLDPHSFRFGKALIYSYPLVIFIPVTFSLVRVSLSESLGIEGQ